MSLCEIPTPSEDLANKYDSMKTTFIKRLMHAYGRIQQATAPVVEKIGQDEHVQVAKGYIEDLQNKPELQAIVKVARLVFMH